MKTSRMLGVMFALLFLLGLAVAPAYAQSGQACITSVSNPANVTGMNNFQTLCGQPAVYTFNYSGNNDMALIEMATQPQNSASFYVFTQPEFAKGINMANPLNGSGDTNNAQFDSALGVPVGSGTALTSKDSDGNTIFLQNGDLLWRGDNPVAGTYYVVVQPRTDQPSSFWINASGAGVSGFRYFGSGAQQSTQQLAMTTTSAGTAGAKAPLGAPRTLPLTGGESEVVQLLAAGAALVSAGLFLRRRK